MMPRSSPSLLSSPLVHFRAAAASGGEGNVSSSSNNNRNATTERLRSTEEKWSFTAEAGRRGKVKGGVVFSASGRVKIPIVGVEVPKPKLPAKVDAMVSGNGRTVRDCSASTAIVKMRFGGRNNRKFDGTIGREGCWTKIEKWTRRTHKGMMKTVRTVQICPELTEQPIMAARERRRASRAGDANLAKG